MPTEADIRTLLDVRRGLRTDRRNTRRRERYREMHPRACGGCGKDLTGTWLRHCAPCQAFRELKQRTCVGVAGVVCHEYVSGTRKQRCLYHELIRADQVRLARNQRRRNSQ